MLRRASRQRSALAPRRLGASGLTRTLYYAHARVSSAVESPPLRSGVSAAAPRSLRRCAALYRVHVSEQMMA